jgi:predicted HAD superfamily Cof-like phosphohydrolase
MKYIFDKVKEFNEAFGIDIKAQSKELRYDLFKEEADEYLNALNDVDRADAIADMLYIWAGTVLKYGIEDIYISGNYDIEVEDIEDESVYSIHRDLTIYNQDYELLCDDWDCKEALFFLLVVITYAIHKHNLQDKIEAIFNAVHKSNMAKLGPDRKPIINGQNGVLYPGKPLNKVMKPEGWKDPKEKIFKILSEN